MKFPSFKDLADNYSNISWGGEIPNDRDRPLGLIDAQFYADDRKLAFARGWFREVSRDELTPVGTKGRRFLLDGNEYFLDESESTYMDPAESTVECFFLDGPYLKFLKPRPPTNNAMSLEAAVVTGRVEGQTLVTEHGVRPMSGARRAL